VAFAGGVSGTDAVPLTDPAVTGLSIYELHLSAALGSGTLSPLDQGLPLGARVLPVTGLMELCVALPNCGAVLPLPLTSGGTAGLGIGGALITGTTFTERRRHAAWTLDSAALHYTVGSGATDTSVSTVGFMHGPLSATSSVLPSGVLQVVTPTHIRHKTIPGNLYYQGYITRLTIQFLPEPRQSLMFLAAAGALFLMGRRRSRRGASLDSPES
jgi:hypothetical protein